MCCLLVELKWFLAPADVREVLDRRKEVQRGTKQMERLVAAMRHGVPQLLEVLGIDSRYSIAAVVATREWIGNADAQHPDVPVIRADHLGAKLNRVAYLDEAIRWLKARDYLPVEERHYRVRATKRRIAGYTVRWYGVKPLIHGSYVPI
jgi:hypothetical protein